MALCGASAFMAGALTLLPVPVAAAPLDDPPPRSESSGSSRLDEPGTHVKLRDGAPDLPDDVSALSWLVADAESGDVLAAHDAHEPLPPASTMKTLFALTALPRLSGADTHTVTDEELATVGEGSSLVGVAPGNTYRVADLWRGVFLSSGNDAVHVLAEMNGGWEETAAQMEEKARSLGALDTNVVSPDGYDAPGQVSSAFDLAVFGRAGLAIPEFAEYASTVDAQFPGNTDSDGTPTWTYGILNTNRLLTGVGGVEAYPGLIGIKNGYTTEAGNTLIAAARRDGRTILVTVMNPQESGGHALYGEARDLLDWGFDAAGHVSPVGSLQPPAPRADPPARQVTPHAGPEPVAPEPLPTPERPLGGEEYGDGSAYAWVGGVVGAAFLTAGLIVVRRNRAPVRWGRILPARWAASATVRRLRLRLRRRAADL